MIFGLERIELGRTDTALRGLSMGASAGLFAGAVAGTMGLWDEDTSWAIVGALGALGAHLRDARPDGFQPMNVNFGLFPPIVQPDGKRVPKKARKPALAARALADLEAWMSQTAVAAE